MNIQSEYLFTASEEDSGVRIDKFLFDKITSQVTVSRKKIQETVLSGGVKLNNHTAFNQDKRLTRGDVISISLKLEENNELIAQKVPFGIVYEDNDLLIVDKPAGIAVYPGVGNPNNTLVNGLLEYLGDNISPHPLRPGIVHRLDKNTSGLMIVAKKEAIHEQLTCDLSLRKISRTYLAIVYGKLTPAIGTINAKLQKSRNDPTRVIVSHSGREAITRYRVQKYLLYGGCCHLSLVECKLETGRTHQIRAHMRYKGTPILGDSKYSVGYQIKFLGLPDKISDILYAMQRQALHAHQLSFTHNQEHLIFISKPPQDIQEIIELF